MSISIDRSTPTLGADPAPKDHWNALSAFQRDTLTVIALLTAAEDHRPYGLAIKDQLEARYDDDVNHGRLYPNLDTLVEAGLVTKSAYDDRTNRYELTELGVDTLAAGRDTIADALAELDESDTDTEERAA